MKFLRAIIFAVACSIFFTVQLPARDMHRPDHLSPERVVLFLERVRKNSTGENFSVDLNFKLRAASGGTIKFGKLSLLRGNGCNVFQINFDGSVCLLTIGREMKIEGNGEFFLNEPFFPDLIFAPSDLSFLFPGDMEYSYAGPNRVAGRPVQQFLCHPQNLSGCESVRISIDSKFLVALRVDFLGTGSELRKRISANAFKNFDGIWMAKAIEFVDFQNHSRSKLEISSVNFIDIEH
jgi:hypothetical protein